MTFWRDLKFFVGDAALVASKDLRIEWRARSAFGQSWPFAALVLVLFGFAFDANRPTLELATPGLLAMTMLFVAVVTVQRSVAVESADGARRMLLLSGMAPAAAFAGKSAAVAVQLLIVLVLLIPGVAVLYGASVESVPLVAATGVAAALGLATAGSLLGAVVAGVRTQQAVLSVLLLPVSAPVLVAASRAFGDGFGTVAVNGWSWVGLLLAFAAVNAALGASVYGALLEET
ncbi:MAG: heme exporter protein CcmB [Acidimicrobiaceae bacterium]|nr:heme exporter protein CcmB [Acidimicrobiaceae bacterium]MCY4175926.1 heme exporter protein CcmB [Acidimicrobiaceae bacterium]MCY4280835.1 heme exporter protein CcmB [Acidimicrobiaceae bacterium]MCY4293290.1 heme exporter protein CcmB [Acidimicrobiaceae bacterium]